MEHFTQKNLLPYLFIFSASLVCLFFILPFWSRWAARPALAAANTYTVDTAETGSIRGSDCTTPVAGECGLHDALDAAGDAAGTVEIVFSIPTSSSAWRCYDGSFNEV